MMKAATTQEQEAVASEALATIEKEIEPLLSNAAPFFNGSEKMTLAEAIVAPFLLRFYSSSNGQLMPKSLKEGMEKLPNFGKWASNVLKQESVLYIWDEEKVLKRTAMRIEKMRAQAK